MTPHCEQVLEALTGEGLGPELRAHLATCADCRAVVAAYQDAGSAAPPPAPASEAVLERLRATSAEELRAHPTVRTWRTQATAATLAYLVIGLLGALALGVRWSQLRGTDALTLWGAGALLIAVLGVGVFAGLAPRPRALLALFGAATIAGTALLVLGGEPLERGRTFLEEGIPCMTTEVALSLLPLAIAAWLLAQTAFRLSRAFALGFGAAAVGLFTLHLHCEQGMWAHLLLFHVLPAVGLVLLLAAVRRLLPTRSYAP